MRNRTPDSSHRSLRDELQSENTQALLNRLETEVEKGEMCDLTELETVLDILDERVPLEDENRDTPEESLRKFRAKYAPMLTSDQEEEEEETSIRHPARRRIARVALAACLCVVMALAVAQACGVNLIEQFLEWRKETFVLHTSSVGGQMTLEHPSEGEYTSMAEALAHYGVTDTIVPTWIPDGFSVQYIQVSELPHSVNLTASYTAGEREILLKVYFDPGDNGSDVHAEHSDPASEKYKANGITFLLSSNNEQYRAAWVIGRYACNMNGDLTESEIKQMLDSISTEG